MDATLRYTYHISNDYFIWLQNNGVDITKMMSNKENGAKRPTFLCFNDSQNPKILWMVPISSRYEKYKRIKEEKENRFNREEVGIVLGKYNGKDNVFLIQNAFPILERFIDHVHTRNKMPIPVSVEIADEVRNKLHKLRHIRKSGNTRLGFVDIEQIEKLLLNELSVCEEEQITIGDNLTSQERIIEQTEVAATVAQDIKK